jgi:hypothetical protein
MLKSCLLLVPKYTLETNVALKKGVLIIQSNMDMEHQKRFRDQMHYVNDNIGNGIVTIMLPVNAKFQFIKL